MSETCSGLRAALALAFAVTLTGTANAKPNPRDVEAARIEQGALKAYAAGDVKAAIGTLTLALLKCEPPNGCSATTRARLHVTLGSVRGSGDGDYAAAKREYLRALGLDPRAKLRASAAPKLVATFDEARADLASGKTSDDPSPSPSPSPTPTPSPAPAPHRPVTVSDLFHQDETPPPKTEKTEKPGEEEPKHWSNWLSVRPVLDFAYLSDANICSPGAGPSYFCADEKNAAYSGRPQPNDDVSSGFALSTARLVLGYERLLFGGLTAGAFVGVGTRFGPSPAGRGSSASPLSVDVRATYTFGENPYGEGKARVLPFVLVGLGAADFDTHVKIRVNEIPCAGTVAQACQRDLNAYRLVGGLNATFGGGARFQIEGRHAVRAGLRGTLVFGEGGFFVSPEVAYEFGL